MFSSSIVILHLGTLDVIGSLCKFKNR